MSGDPRLQENPALHPVTGYRDLSQDEIDLINAIKAHAEATRALVERVGHRANQVSHASHSNSDAYVKTAAAEQHRWINIARTHLQQGYMALTRAVARPMTF